MKVCSDYCRDLSNYITWDWSMACQKVRVADWSCLKELHLDDDVKDDFDSRLHLLASSHKLKFRGVYTTIWEGWWWFDRQYFQCVLPRGLCDIFWAASPALRLLILIDEWKWATAVQCNIAAQYRYEAKGWSHAEKHGQKCVNCFESNICLVSSPVWAWLVLPCLHVYRHCPF